MKKLFLTFLLMPLALLAQGPNGVSMRSNFGRGTNASFYSVDGAAMLNFNGVGSVGGPTNGFDIDHADGEIDFVAFGDVTAFNFDKSLGTSSYIYGAGVRSSGTISNINGLNQSLWIVTNNIPNQPAPNGSIATSTSGALYLRTNGTWIQIPTSSAAASSGNYTNSDYAGLAARLDRFGANAVNFAIALTKDWAGIPSVPWGVNTNGGEFSQYLTVNNVITNSGVAGSPTTWISTNATPNEPKPNGSIATVTDGRMFIRSNGAWVALSTGSSGGGGGGGAQNIFPDPGAAGYAIIGTNAYGFSITNNTAAANNLISIDWSGNVTSKGNASFGAYQNPIAASGQGFMFPWWANDGGMNQTAVTALQAIRVNASGTGVETFTPFSGTTSSNSFVLKTGDTMTGALTNQISVTSPLITTPGTNGIITVNSNSLTVATLNAAGLSLTNPITKGSNVLTSTGFQTMSGTMTASNFVGNGSLLTGISATIPSQYVVTNEINRVIVLTNSTVAEAPRYTHISASQLTQFNGTNTISVTNGSVVIQSNSVAVVSLSNGGVLMTNLNGGSNNIYSDGHAAMSGSQTNGGTLSTSGLVNSGATAVFRNGMISNSVNGFEFVNLAGARTNVFANAGTFNSDVTSGGDFQTGAASTAQLKFGSSGSRIRGGMVDGDIAFGNSGFTGFTKLQFGGTTAAFKSIVATNTLGVQISDAVGNLTNAVVRGIVLVQQSTLGAIPNSSAGGTNFIQISYGGLVHTIATNYAASTAYIEQVPSVTGGWTIQVFSP